MYTKNIHIHKPKSCMTGTCTEVCPCVYKYVHNGCTSMCIQVCTQVCPCVYILVSKSTSGHGAHVHVCTARAEPYWDPPVSGSILGCAVTGCFTLPSYITLPMVSTTPLHNARTCKPKSDHTDSLYAHIHCQNAVPIVLLHKFHLHQAAVTPKSGLNQQEAKSSERLTAYGRSAS